MKCNVCQSDMGAPLYDSLSPVALTSLCERQTGQLTVWLCPNCAHLRSRDLPDSTEYYESQYRILLNEEDEDQIYEVNNGQITYRTQHQLNVLRSRLRLHAGIKLLDYGCAKAMMPSRLLQDEPDLDIHLFDVSSMYTEYWKKLTDSSRMAIYETPPHWNGAFDLVTSFFSLEHIAEPLKAVNHISTLLNPDGVFYGVVPDYHGNYADFVVADHINHFSASSLYQLLNLAGFSSIEIDEDAHRGAFVFVARKKGVGQPSGPLHADINRARHVAYHWKQIDAIIAKDDAGTCESAIYGSGFYGAYIATHLSSLDRVKCFIDASPYQQGRDLFGKPILSPSSLPEQVKKVYVGLNPAISRRVMQDLGWSERADLQLVFFDESSQ